MLLGAGIGYLFLIAPNPRRKKRTRWQLSEQFLAHRGLHGENAPENSLAAFQLAAEKGFGIEMDVRRTRDGCLVIHHDESVERTCGVNKLIRDMTETELRSLRLMGTHETIPTLDEALSLIGGRTPLLVEMKSGPGERGLPRALWQRMRDYPGLWWVESFDPRQLIWFRLHARRVLRGQLAFDPHRAGKKQKGVWFFLGAHLLMNFLSRPDFIAYDWEGDRNPTFRLLLRLFHPSAAAWTVKDEKTSERLKAIYTTQIFEGFCPDGEKEKES